MHNNIGTSIFDTFHNSIKLSLFNSIKTNNPVIDAIINTVLLSFMSFIANLAFTGNFTWTMQTFSKNYVKSLFYKRNTIILEGKKCATISVYNATPYITSVFGERFTAIWEFIINNIQHNQSIVEITENMNNFNHCSRTDTSNGLTNLFIVTQKREFLLDSKLEIYALTEIKTEESSGEKGRGGGGGETKTDIITIKIFSYSSSLQKIKEYIDTMALKYISGIEESRMNKQFIYTLYKTKYEECKYECWSEHLFETTRSFNNIYFDRKPEIIQKLDFFLNNKQWYYDMGIPYTLGFGLHGPPGTGKTSLIKCIAAYTKRHIINISFKLVKTRRQLHDFFFEDRYTADNKKGSIGFNNKIIVFEDIDCVGDIVLERNKSIIENKSASRKRGLNDANSLGELLKQTIDKVDEDSKNMSNFVKIPLDDDPITLDDLLNLWDGIRETPGRIIIITSNHYDQLDTALTRPGRIDVSVELSYASHNTITEIFRHFFGYEMDKKSLKQIKAGFYTPAEINNIYLTTMNEYRGNECAFIKRLQQNKKYK